MRVNRQAEKGIAGATCRTSGGVRVVRLAARSKTVKREANTPYAPRKGRGGGSVFWRAILPLGGGKYGAVFRAGCRPDERLRMG